MYLPAGRDPTPAPPLRREGSEVSGTLPSGAPLPSPRGGVGVGRKTISNHRIKKYALVRVDLQIRPQKNNLCNRRNLRLI